VQIHFYVCFLGEMAILAGRKIPPKIRTSDNKYNDLWIPPHRGTVLDNSLKRRTFVRPMAATRKDGR